MKAIRLIPIFALLLTACQTVPDKSRFVYTTAQNPKVIKKLEKEAALQFKDPDSTKFMDVELVKTSYGENRLCGKVNSKNSFGAYTGFRDFMYDGATQTVMTESDDEREYAPNQFKSLGCSTIY